MSAGYKTQEAVAPSRHERHIVDWNVKPQYKLLPYWWFPNRVLGLVLIAPVSDNSKPNKAILINALVARRKENGLQVSDQVLHKPTCTATEEV